MKIAFPYPAYWPYVRRGVERCTHDLATYLASRGHEVHVITSTPGRPRVGWDGKIRVTYLKQLNHPLVYGHGITLRALDFTVRATWALMRLRPQVAYLWTNSGLYWAAALRRRFGINYVSHASVYWEHGQGRRRYPEVAGTNRLLVLNRNAVAQAEDEFGVPATVVNPPVDLATFRPVAQRDQEHPVVFFPSDIADPRKGGDLMLRAWNVIHKEVPRARLVLAGSLGVAGWFQDQYDTSMVSKLGLVKLPAAREAIEFRGPGSLEGLPFDYSRASVTVMPSVREMFGMVLTESLACGTPIVASAHDGPGAIASNPAVGNTVDLRDFGDLHSRQRALDLADAVIRTIDLSRRQDTASACREWAGQWTIDRIGPQVEDILERAASGRIESLAGGPSDANEMALSVNELEEVGV